MWKFHIIECRGCLFISNVYNSNSTQLDACGLFYFIFFDKLYNTNLIANYYVAVFVFYFVYGAAILFTHLLLFVTKLNRKQFVVSITNGKRLFF